jgi:hypothetical protein
MTDKTVDLDEHRGMAAQKATNLRRLLADIAANERALHEAQEELEAQLIAAPASTWEEAVDKVRICYRCLRLRPADKTHTGKY